MTILFAIFAAVAIIALGVVFTMYLSECRENDELLLELAKNDEIIDKLRKSNRSANKYNQKERRELRGELSAAREFARTLEEFHLENQRKLSHELANAYAMVELLFARIPTKAFTKIDRQEASRLFVR